MRHKLAMPVVFVGILLALAGSTVAGPLQPGRVPAAAIWVGHADTEAFLHSAVGGFLLEQLAAPEAQAGLAVLKNLTGLDVTRDIRSITIYGVAPGDENNVAIVEGTFDQDKLLALLKMNPSAREFQVLDVPAWQWQDNPKSADPGPRKFAMFWQDSLLVFAGSEILLEQAAGLLAGRGESLAAGTAALEVQPAPGTYVGLYVARLPVDENDQAARELLGKAVSGRFEIGENEGQFQAKLALVTKDTLTAGNLAKMAEGFLAFLDLIKDVHKDGRAVLPAELQAVVKEVKVQAQEAGVQASLRVPSQKVVDLLRWAAAQARAKKGT